MAFLNNLNNQFLVSVHGLSYSNCFLNRIEQVSTTAAAVFSNIRTGSCEPQPGEFEDRSQKERINTASEVRSPSPLDEPAQSSTAEPSDTKERRASSPLPPDTTTAPLNSPGKNESSASPINTNSTTGNQTTSGTTTEVSSSTTTDGNNLIIPKPVAPSSSSSTTGNQQQPIVPPLIGISSHGHHTQQNNRQSNSISHQQKFAVPALPGYVFD